MVHFLLDTRTTYQKIKDWVRSLFRTRPSTIEIQRVMSSREIRNRTIFNTLNPIPPTEQRHDSPKETSKISRKRRACQFPLGPIAERKNC